MRVFLTGGTGYIGGALSRRLATEGHEIRALIRSRERARGLEGLGVRLFDGDICDRYSLREGMSGADWVIHAAAELDMDAPADRMERTNVQGSENVASLAYKLGVGRFLSVSSVAFFGGSPSDGSAADERAAVSRPFPSRYSATKHAGEKAIRAWAEQGLRVNTVYPSLVYGPPGKGRGLNAYLAALIGGRLPALVGAARRTSWIYLEDLVEGMIRVMERAEPGADYLMAGEASTVAAVAERACELAGVSAPRLRLPLGVAKGVAYALGPVYRRRGRRLPFSLEQLRNLERHWHFDDSKARRELDWERRGLEEGLPATIRHLQQASRARDLETGKRSSRS